jgi:hypothetical protein
MQPTVTIPVFCNSGTGLQQIDKMTNYRKQFNLIFKLIKFFLPFLYDFYTKFDLIRICFFYFYSFFFLVFVHLLFYSFPFSSFHFPSSCCCIPDIVLPLFSPCRTRPYCDLESTPLSSYWLSSHRTFPYPAMLSSFLVTGFLSYLESWPVRMGPTRCPETSVNNYHTTPCNYPEAHRLHQHRSGSLKSTSSLIAAKFCNKINAWNSHKAHDKLYRVYTK